METERRRRARHRASAEQVKGLAVPAQAAAAHRTPPPRADDPFRQDELLKTPMLLEHGPWALLIGGALLSAAFFLAGQWRIDAGRQGVYEAAFHFSRTTAAAVGENVSQVLGRLRQATHHLESLGQDVDDEAARHNLSTAFATGIGLRGEGIEAIAVTQAGDVVAATVPLPLATKLARQLGALAHIGPRSTQLMLPSIPGAIAGRAIVPVVHLLEQFADAAFVVYLVDAELFTSVAKKSFGERLGWLRVEDEFGRSLFETEHAHPITGDLIDTRRLARVGTVAEAARTPMRFDSQRLLVATAPTSRDGLSVAAGIREQDALSEFKTRVDATWLIAWFASAILMGLVGLTALALRRFRAKEEYLRRLATVDILSGLPNRRSFNHLLAREVNKSTQEGKPLALFFVDLDNFKYVNDSLGHEAGDSLLRYAAAVLTRTVGRQGRVCRLGGDEFTILIPGLGTTKEAQRFGDRIVEAQHAPFELDGVEIQPRASVGASLLPLQASTASDLMRFADTAMYRAKEDGKSCCVIYGERMAAQELAKVRAVRELERGLAREEFFLVYQPKYSLSTGELCGFEALVRWNHPQRGTVLPAEFIGLAEESGLIAELGDWVLENAVYQVLRWHREGFGWHQIAVNISPLQLRSRDIVARVGDLLNSYEVPGRCLQLELTESSLAADTSKAQSLLRALRQFGVVIAVDDFGTGYSSMGALQRFELDFLKVDRSFVRALDTRHGQEICRAVVSLGHALKMRVIAEGVETPEQNQILAVLGCDEVQGYLYSPPVGPEEASVLARRGFATFSQSESAPIALPDSALPLD